MKFQNCILINFVTDARTHARTSQKQYAHSTFPKLGAYKVSESHPNLCYNKLCYCRFRNFCENFIFPNSIKRHISDVKN